MKPIWYFVGLLLTIMGAIIAVEGFFLLANPPAKQTMLGTTHPDLWWGGLMIAGGVAFVLANRKKVVE